MLRRFNSATYIHWCNHLQVPLLKKIVDFNSHKLSLNGTQTTLTSQVLNCRSTKEIIANTIMAV
jgi:hypothetical protein